MENRPLLKAQKYEEEEEKISASKDSSTLNLVINMEGFANTSKISSIHS